MIYQSMSGDASEGKGEFTMNGGTLESLEGGMFYVTNTIADIKLKAVELKYATDDLLSVEKAGWGTEGSNGGQVNFTATKQKLEGVITVDEISRANIGLEDGSEFTGQINSDGKTYVKINDYKKLRILFGNLLSEIQRIKSEGDFEAARALVESYGVKVDPELHAEILKRYEGLNLAPYKGFVNPRYEPVLDANGEILDVKVIYGEGYAEQMLRYSRDYSMKE